jgi:hypothetical protein
VIDLEAEDIRGHRAWLLNQKRLSFSTEFAYRDWCRDVSKVATSLRAAKKDSPAAKALEASLFAEGVVINKNGELVVAFVSELPPSKPAPEQPTNDLEARRAWAMKRKLMSYPTGDLASAWVASVSRRLLEMRLASAPVKARILSELEAEGIEVIDNQAYIKLGGENGSA